MARGPYHNETEQVAEQAGVAHLVRFVEGDFFLADISQATVVTLYLLPEVNRHLLPKLRDDRKPGTRIVSYKSDLGDWAPEKTVPVGRGIVYYWVVPPRAGQRDGQDGTFARRIGSALRSRCRGAYPSRLLKNPFSPRLLKKVQMQGGARGEVRDVLSPYVTAPRERANAADGPFSATC